ncbi:MAG: ABC-2 type transport system permease protein [Halobacteriales archaeon]|jgi:ABC-2 type transport system permease protein
MFETTRFEAEQRVPGSVVIAVALAIFAAMMTLLAPSFLDEVDMAALVEQFPRRMVEVLDLEVMATMEGFIALELYEYVWLLGLGVYLAYSAAGTIAGDVETDRLDALLAAPVSRTQILLEKFLALLTPILIVNVVVLVAVYAGAAFVDKPIAVPDLVAVHGLSVPYLLFCGAVGMLASVLARRRLVAEGVAAGAIIGTFILQTLTTGTDVEWIGTIAPSQYYTPVEVLTISEYDLAGAGILLAGTVVLLLVSIAWFREVDVQ